MALLIFGGREEGPVTAGNRIRWVTFDCFGTLVDWQSGFAEILAPLAGERHAELLRAYHAHERGIEREKPHRRYRDVLAAALLRAATETGTSVSEADAHALARSWGSMRVF